MLCSFDAQWEEILLHIQGKKAPLTKDDIEDFQKDLAMEKDVYAKCSKILYTTMMQYTKGDAKTKTISSGVTGCMPSAPRSSTRR